MPKEVIVADHLEKCQELLPGFNRTLWLCPGFKALPEPTMLPWMQAPEQTTLRDVSAARFS